MTGSSITGWENTTHLAGEILDEGQLRIQTGAKRMVSLGWPTPAGAPGVQSAT